MSARTKSKVTPKYKTKYRVRNWETYEESLRRRGDITIWFDEAAVAAWEAEPSGRPGGQLQYSDLAVNTALTLRSVFHLALRQTEGFVTSLIRLMGLELATPDHSTLSRRGKTVEVPAMSRLRSGPLHLVIDSTGLKIVGGGEWNADKNGISKRRRQWRKLHLGIDVGGFIVVSALTGRGEDDGRVGVDLLGELDAPVASFRADGAYDTKPVYAALASAGMSERSTSRFLLVGQPRILALPSASGSNENRRSRGLRRWAGVSGARSPALISRLERRMGCSGSNRSSAANFGLGRWKGRKGRRWSA